MRLQQDSLREALAAEYVLGTLRGRARARFETYLRTDVDLQARIELWAGLLQPLAGQVAPVAPPARVWTAIQMRLGLVDAPARTSAGSGRRWWRGAWASTAVAALLVLALWLEPAPEVVEFTPDIQLALQNQQAQPVWEVEADSATDTVVVRPARNIRVPTRKSLELWLVLASGESPVSLGLMPTTPGQKYVVKSSVPLDEGIGFAVSLEPEGGSPTGVATGPILYIQTYRDT